jgi:hypothetical protein
MAANYSLHGALYEYLSDDHNDFIVVKQPHHMSILTGEAWVMELLAGHPLHILSQLGVQHHV